MKIGLDFGGVISSGTNGNNDTCWFGENFLETLPMKNAFQAITILSQEHELFIVSKCGIKNQQRTRDWCYHHNLEKLIPYSNWYFCIYRDGKKPIAQELELDVFVDDRLEVLSYLIGIVPKLILFNSKQAEVRKHKKYLKDVQTCNTWIKVLDLV